MLQAAAAQTSRKGCQRRAVSSAAFRYPPSSDSLAPTEQASVTASPRCGRYPRLITCSSGGGRAQARGSIRVRAVVTDFLGAIVQAG